MSELASGSVKGSCVTLFSISAALYQTPSSESRLPAPQRVSELASESVKSAASGCLVTAAAGRTASGAAGRRLTGIRILTVSAHSYDLIYICNEILQSLLSALKNDHILIAHYLLVSRLDILIKLLDEIGVLILSAHSLCKFRAESTEAIYILIEFLVLIIHLLCKV